MRTRTIGSLMLGAATVAALAACGGGSSPSTPSTPVPTAQPTPTPTPTPGSGLPPGMSCNPTPPPLYGMKVGVHDNSSSRIILNANPLVMNVDGYCARVGAGGDGQKFCETREETHPDRVACDYLAVGKSAATGRWGPTWTWDGKPCDGDNFTSCANHQTNQFLAIAKTSGRYEACAAPGVPIHPEGGPCGGITIK